MSVVLDTKMVDNIMAEYPVLEIALQSGVVSIKMVRELLNVDRWYMQDLYKQLVMAGAVTGVSTSAFRATQQLTMYLKSRVSEPKSN